MAHIPYGYDVIDGKAVINEEKAEVVRAVFTDYLGGASLGEIARNAGYEKSHSSIGNMLKNERYLGDDFYPQLITRELFDKVANERRVRAERLGRIRDYLETPEKTAREYIFRVPKTEVIASDPFEQAGYIYSRVEVEIKNG